MSQDKWSKQQWLGLHDWARDREEEDKITMHSPDPDKLGRHRWIVRIHGQKVLILTHFGS
jgi:hypothetical protein